MIVGVGTDIIEIKRIRKAIEKERFINRYFTEREINQFKERNFSPQTVAGVFSAKEAIVKAMGTGFSGFSPADIEVLKDESGKPYANIYNNAKSICDKKGIKNIHISISHCKEYAQGFAVAEGDTFNITE